MTNPCDWDEYIAPPEEYYMTLTYGMIADGGIVMAADSQITDQPDFGSRGRPKIVATYTDQRSKIRKLTNGSAFTIAGNSGTIDALLAKADEIDDSGPFEDVVQAYRRLFQVEYCKLFDQKPGADCAFLFCGYIDIGKKKTAQILKLSSHNTFTSNPVATGQGHGFTGREQHGGALYLHHRFYRDLMPVDSAKCLAYCVLAEVVEMDNMVGGPIEMAVVTPAGVEAFSGFDAYEKKRQQIIEAVRSLVRAT